MEYTNYRGTFYKDNINIANFALSYRNDTPKRPCRSDCTRVDDMASHDYELDYFFYVYAITL